MEAGPIQVHCLSQEPLDVNAAIVDVPITSPQPATVPQEPTQPTVTDRLRAPSTADNASSDRQNSELLEAMKEK